MKVYSKERRKINEAAEKSESFHTNIEQTTLDNEDYRRVLHTTGNNQLVVMSIEPDDEIGEEVHDTIDQFIRVESGEGKAIIDDEEIELSDGSAIIIPKGSKHNIINTSSEEPLKLYTIYSPPNHPAGTIQKTKADSLEEEAGSPRTLNDVNKHIQKKYPDLGVAKHYDTAGSYYWYSDNEKLGLYLAGLYSTTIDFAVRPSSFSYDEWTKEADEIMKDFKG